MARLRLAAQRIAGAGFATPVEAVRWMTAMQAQDLRGAMTSVALRTVAGTRSDVEAALNAGQVVRSWPMRGTLHFVAAEDLRWMLEVTGARTISGLAARHRQLGLDEATRERAVEVATAAFGGRGLLRKELFSTWDAAGVATDGQRGVHLLSYLCLRGVACLGPLAGAEQLVVLTEDWIRGPRRLARDEALAEWVDRYFRSHGPATVKDAARWMGLSLTDVRTGLAAAAPDLERLEVDGVEHFMDPATPEVLAACQREAQGVFLLPGFDEYVLGYGDRRAMVDGRFSDRIVPGANGMFRPTVVAGGQIIGTWKHVGRGTKRDLEATPFDSFSGTVTRRLPRAYAALQQREGTRT